LRGLRGAVILLTRFPAGGTARERGALAGSVRWFPLVGALIGLVVGAMYALGTQWLPSLVAGLIAILVGVMVTGGLHEDGLGDIADAFGGGSDPAEVARILKDPRQGTFGVLAIAGALSVRAGALGSVSPLDGVAMAVAAHVIGRTAIVIAMRFHPVAPGLAASYASTVTTVDLFVAIGIGVGLAAFASGIWVLACLAIALAAVRIMGRLAVKKLGGVSGDVLGGIEQVTESAILVLGAAAAHEGWIRPAWWA
jgi:adenosylcobinamide-GDP ribazoletransferase